MTLLEVQGKKLRPYIDYRKLNTVIKTEFYPLRNTEARIEKVSSVKYITVLDVSIRYLQTPITLRA